MALIVLPALMLVLSVTVWALSETRRRRRLERELEAVRARSRVDDEVVLRSREAFSEDLEIELRRVERTGRPATLVVFSLDHGAVGGDAAVDRRRTFARVLRSAVRAVDVGYRTGTDEFALILPETRARGALVAAERVEQAVRASGAGALRAGIAEAGPGIDRHELFRNAYCALLAAGDSGRPRTLAYSPELERRPGAGTFAGLAEVEPIRGSHRAHR